MPATMMFRLSFDNQWDRDSCQRYIKEYKKFMLLASKKESAPSQIVDLVWGDFSADISTDNSFDDGEFGGSSAGCASCASCGGGD